MSEKAGSKTYTLTDLNTEKPRWCAGCGDHSILQTLKKFIVEKKLDPAKVVNISGIGCSSRAPHYLNTYGFNAIHGRPIPVATGLALVRDDLNIFIHSGDGDALSIGGNHLMHGINKNINCVFLLYDNELYALTKNQTSPTTPLGHPTNTQPAGTLLPAMNPARLALSLGGTFVARTADWIPDHLFQTIETAFEHKGFSFIHILQRCPHFFPQSYNYKKYDWLIFLEHKKGVLVSENLRKKVKIVEHDPADLQKALEFTRQDKVHLGVFYKNSEKDCYEHILYNKIEAVEQKKRSRLLDRYLV